MEWDPCWPQDLCRAKIYCGLLFGIHTFFYWALACWCLQSEFDIYAEQRFWWMLIAGEWFTTGYYLTVPFSISYESEGKKPKSSHRPISYSVTDLKPETCLSIKYTFSSLYLGMYSEQSFGISTGNKIKVAAAAITGLLPAGPRLGACWR